MNVIKTRLQSLAWDEVQAKPAYGLDGDRRKGGVSLVPALMENVGTCRHDAKGRPQWKTHKDQVPMRGTGADQPVVASKPGNAGGAKGLNGSADGMDQPARGGIHARSKVVRTARRRGRRSTRKRRSRWLRPSRTRFPNRWSGRLTRRSRPTRALPGWTVSP